MSCSVVGCEGDGRFPYECERCGGTYCPDHRLPENHSCPGLQRGSDGGAWFPDRSGSVKSSSSSSVWKKLFGVFVVAAVIAGAVGLVVANPGIVPSVELGLGADDELDEENVEQLLHEEINDYRANQSVGRLDYDEELEEIADYHSDNMAANEDIYHTSPGGQTVGDRYDRFGYDCRVSDGDGYLTSGENVAQTWYQEDLTTGDYYGSPEELAAGIAQQLINSPEHRENLVDDVWRVQGIGINITEQDGNTAVFVTQTFC